MDFFFKYTTQIRVVDHHYYFRKSWQVKYLFSHRTRGLQKFYLVLLHSLLNRREIKLASLSSKSFNKPNKDSRATPETKYIQRSKVNSGILREAAEGRIWLVNEVLTFEQPYLPAAVIALIRSHWRPYHSINYKLDNLLSETLLEHRYHTCYHSLLQTCYHWLLHSLSAVRISVFRQSSSLWNF